MPSNGFLLKTYKELLRKLKPQHGLDEPQHSSASVAALKAVTERKFSARASPTRAFARLKQYVLECQPSSDQTSISSHEAPPAVANRLVMPATVAKDPQLKTLFGTDGMMRAGLMYLVATMSKRLLKDTSVTGREHLEAAMQRETGRPLITVSNHVSALDDPLVISAILPEEYHQQPHALRWTMCATDRCFTNPLFTAFFRTVKVLPVERGAGLNQLGMQAAEDRLASGDWVHIFPEGTRSRSGKLGPARKGVGRLIAACSQPPLVLPFVHRGMADVMPRGSILPRAGQQVEVLVGEPVQVEDLLSRSARERWSEEQLYQALAARVDSRLRELHAQLHGEVRQPTTAEPQQQLSPELSVAWRPPGSWQQHWPLPGSIPMHPQHSSACGMAPQVARDGARGLSAPLGRAVGRVTALGAYMRECTAQAARLVQPDIGPAYL